MTFRLPNNLDHSKILFSHSCRTKKWGKSFLSKEIIYQASESPVIILDQTLVIRGVEEKLRALITHHTLLFRWKHFNWEILEVKWVVTLVNEEVWYRKITNRYSTSLVHQHHLLHYASENGSNVFEWLYMVQKHTEIKLLLLRFIFYYLFHKVKVEIGSFFIAAIILNHYILLLNCEIKKLDQVHLEHLNESRESQ